MQPFRLPESFLFGTATAGLQVEGGSVPSNWLRWCDEDRIRDGSHCRRADDHWNRVGADTELLRSLGVQTIRLGVEWSRIEPEEGRFDESALAHYRAEIEGLLKAGIRTLVTLHHFSHPLWFEDSGGWEDSRAPDRFVRYVRKVVESLGELVNDWITINEPNVYAYNGYITGEWPPGKKNIRAMFRCIRGMSLAHIDAYRTIREIRSAKGFPGDTKVGVANHVRVFDPADSAIGSRIAAALLDRLFHGIFMEAMGRGIFRLPLGVGRPRGKGRFYDFIGINYYSRYMVSLHLLPFRFSLGFREGAEKNDLGWEIYPEGLYREGVKLYRKYGAPVWITENGTADAKDAFRSRYLADHLAQVRRLLDDGVPVERYYHWTFIDNFEWTEGESAHFGLVENDFPSQKRKIRESGKLYSRICREKGLTADAIRESGI
jgi:beta-glucosidase